MEKVAQCDTVLWRQFQAGDAHAFTLLVDRYSDILYDYGTRFSPDGELIKDCIQDVFCVLWNRREYLSEVSSVKFYLMKALRQRVIRELPKWQCRISLDQPHADDLPFDIEIKDDPDIPLEIRHKLISYIKGLSPRQKELLYLRFYKNLKQEKVAQLMGLNRQSVYNLQRSALLALRKLIDYESIAALISPSFFFIFFHFVK